MTKIADRHRKESSVDLATILAGLLGGVHLNGASEPDSIPDGMVIGRKIYRKTFKGKIKRSGIPA